MGAGARQRGDAVIREQLSKPQLIQVKSAYLSRLETELVNISEDKSRLAEELTRAHALIARVRAENEVLKEEKRRFKSIVSETRRHICVVGNSKARWTVSLVMRRLEAAGLI